MLLHRVQGLLKLRAEVLVAGSPQDASKILRNEPDIEVAVADMRMPGTDGVQFLESVSADYPNIVRLMLTGDDDPATTMAAINRAGVFRFLAKPVESKDLVDAVSRASQHFRKSRRLDDERKGNLDCPQRLLSTLMECTAPALWKLSDRVASLVGSAAVHAELTDPDQLAKVSRFALCGFAIEDQQAAKHYSQGAKLTAGLRDRLRQGIELSTRILSLVPPLRDALPRIKTLYSEGRGDPLSSDAIFIRQVFELLRRAGHASKLSVLSQMLREEANETERRLLLNLKTYLFSHSSHEVSAEELSAGMVLAQPVIGPNNQCLLVEGTELSDSLIARLHSFAENARMEGDSFWIVT